MIKHRKYLITFKPRQMAEFYIRHLQTHFVQWKMFVILFKFQWLDNNPVSFQTMAENGRLTTLSPRQMGRHFADDNFKCVFFNKIFWILNISLNYVHEGPIENVIICLDNGLAPNRRQAIIRTTDNLVYWRIYVSLGLNYLISALKSTKMPMS